MPSDQEPSLTSSHSAARAYRPPVAGPRAQGTERKSPFAHRLPWWGPPSWFLPEACLACTQSCVPQHLPVPRLPPGRWRLVPPAETQDPHGPDRLRQLQHPEQQAVELLGTLTQHCSPLSSLCGAAGRPEVTGCLAGPRPVAAVRARIAAAGLLLPEGLG